MTSPSGKPPLNSKQNDTPDLIMEVESIADSDNSRKVNNINSEESQESIDVEHVTEDEYMVEVDSVELHIDESAGLCEESEESETDMEDDHCKVNFRDPRNDRPQRFTMKLLNDWCETNNVQLDLATVKAEVLSDILCRFYREIRSKAGQRYSRNTIMAIRYGLNRHFASMEPPRNIDIIDDAEFRKANEVFKSVVKSAAKENPEKVSPRITTSDLRKMYSSQAFSPFTPITLLFKVWFEISLYFNRRRIKQIRETKITDFVFETDNDGRRFAAEIDRDESHAGFRMYEKVGDRMCPVASLEKLLSKIDPNCQYLFQRPRYNKEGDEIWYIPERVGRNFASQLMSKISRLAQLDQKYTNVSLKKLSVWSLEELVFQHRHIVKTEAPVVKLKQHNNETPMKKDGASIPPSASGISRAILPPNTKSEERAGAFKPYNRKRAHSDSDRKGPDPIDVSTAKAKVKRIFQRLRYGDLVNFVDWLKRIDVLKDTSGTVFCRENCYPALACKPESSSMRGYPLQQVQQDQGRLPPTYVLPSPLDLSQYFANNAYRQTNGLNQQAPLLASQNSQIPQHQNKPTAALTTPIVQQAPKYDDVRMAYGSSQKGTQFQTRKQMPIAPRPIKACMPPKEMRVHLSNPSQLNHPSASPSGSYPVRAPELRAPVVHAPVTHNSSVTPDGASADDDQSSVNKLKISQVTGESKVWRIL